MAAMNPRAPDNPLYPPLEPFATGQLAVGDGHAMYFEQCGTPTGMPVVFLHGGPGSACSPAHRQFFDPKVFRAVLFDQRGCGRSQSPLRLSHNTTDALVADIEALRQHLGIARWLVVGGSWGAGLGLAYAAAHPQACAGLVLRGVFLGRAADVDWFFQGVGQLLPDAWDRLTQPAPRAALATQGGLLAWLQAELNSTQPQRALQAALAWEAWEQSVSQRCAVPQRPQPASEADAGRLVAKYQLQSHYLTHHCFRGAHGLLQDAAALAGLPVAILHGRLDWVCRPQAAWEVHQRLPHSRLTWVDGCGHSPFEPGMAQALVGTIDHFAAQGDFAHWSQCLEPVTPP